MSERPIKSLFSKSKGVKIAVGSLIAAVFITVLSLVIYEETKNQVLVSVNGEEQQVKTHAKTVEAVLAEEGIKVSKHDVVEPALDGKVEDGMSIQWEQAKQVAVIVDGQEQKLWTTNDQVEQVLAEAGVELTEHDAVNPERQATITDDNKIYVDKAYAFTLIDGLEKQEQWTTKTSVKQFLASKEIVLNEFDRFEFEGVEEGIIKPGSVVQVVRVEKSSDTVQEAADFDVETRKDNTLLKGREKVVQQGEKGKVEKTYEIVKENGQEISRTVVAEKVVTKPTNKVVSVGTKTVVASANTGTSTGGKKAVSTGTTVSRDNGAPSGGKEFYVEATAYTPYCTGCSGISAAGINLRANPGLKLIAVDPRVIPMGSKVWVEGYGYAVAGDTGGAIKGNRIDVLVQSKGQAYNWGRKKVKIRVM